MLKRFLALFRKSDPGVSASQVLIVVRGPSSLLNYHLSADGGRESLCGRFTLCTGVPLSSWGFTRGISPATYCVQCENKAKPYGVRLGKPAAIGVKQ